LIATGDSFRPAYDTPVRAVVLDEAGRPELAEVPKPEPGSGDALVQMEVALTNGEALRGAFCGVDVATGRRVVAAGLLWPYAEYLLVPEADLLLAPPNLTADVVALAVPLASCLEAIELGEIGPGQTLAVKRRGTVELLLSAAARDAGAAIALGGDPELAAAFGAVPGDRKGADIVIDAEGARPPITKTVRAALAFLASGAHPWERLITHRVGLDELPELLADPPQDLLTAAVYP
jgi:threonine dehydrogenase-like Zn-dependent dehydrogenase